MQRYGCQEFGLSLGAKIWGRTSEGQSRGTIENKAVGACWMVSRTNRVPMAYVICDVIHLDVSISHAIMDLAKRALPSSQQAAFAVHHQAK